LAGESVVEALYSENKIVFFGQELGRDTYEGALNVFMADVDRLYGLYSYYISDKLLRIDVSAFELTF